MWSDQFKMVLLAIRANMSRKSLALWGQLSRTIALIGMSVLGTSIGVELILPPPVRLVAIAQSSEGLCPSPALSRLQSHQVVAGDTIDSIAANYKLLPVTLLAMNPSLQSGPLTLGTTLRIPPFNGIEVPVTAGQTWQDLATVYQMRADVLFEVNGCPDILPNRIFVPGVSWLLDVTTTVDNGSENINTDPLTVYPLNDQGTLVANYGWQSDLSRGELVFSSGVTLEVTLETAVLAAGSGTVAYVGEEATLGTLIVINHAQGFQTRYASISAPIVRVGDQVTAGQTIATSSPRAENAETAELYFEVRTNSTLGWVARDPGDYVPELAVW